MRRLAIVLSLVLVAPAIASAAPVQPDATKPVAEPIAAPPPDIDATTEPSIDESVRPELKVIRLSLPPTSAKTPSEKRKEKARQSALTASLGDSIELETSPELRGYLEYAAEHDNAVTLFLDGNDTGITAEEVDLEAGTLRFHLQRNSDNKDVWSALLRYPFQTKTRKVKASIGLAGGVAAPADRSTFTLVIVRWTWYTGLWLVFTYLVLLAFGTLVVKCDLLRDGPNPAPYSLGRCQMAWWSGFVTFAYVTIWLISGDLETITPSLLALMGISALTAVGSVMIDSLRDGEGLSQAATDRLAFQAAQQNAQQAESAAREAAGKAPTDPVVQKQLGAAQAALAVIGAKLLAVNATINRVVAPPVTSGFLRDIVSDSNGTAGLHRFQMIVWTVVLGIIFVVAVVTNLNMPEFSPTLLATMGISSGTYLGFKFPER